MSRLYEDVDRLLMTFETLTDEQKKHGYEERCHLRVELMDRVRVLEIRAAKAEGELLDIHDALHAECVDGHDLVAEIRSLRRRAK